MTEEGFPQPPMIILEPYVVKFTKLRMRNCEGGFRGEHQGERRPCNHDDAEEGEG